MLSRLYLNLQGEDKIFFRKDLKYILKTYFKGVGLKWALVSFENGSGANEAISDDWHR